MLKIQNHQEKYPIKMSETNPNSQYIQYEHIKSVAQTSTKLSEQSMLSPHYPILTSHEQRLQQTYNYQCLFRKKSNLLNKNKNKKRFPKQIQDGKQDSDKQSKNVKKGHWSLQENKRYHWFLQIYNKHFIMKHLRRTDKIFKSMSTFIGSRQAQQCRSHHQKMQKKYKSFYQIIIKLRKQYYSSCNSEFIKNELQQNNYLKDSSDLLIEQTLLKPIQNAKDQESQNDPSRRDDQSHQLIHLMSKNYQNHMNQQQDDSHSQENKQANCFFDQNYQKQLNFKIN